MRNCVVFLVLLLVMPLAFAAEPDNSYSNASWIPTDGTWENHTFEYAGDTDFVKFNATSGAFYLIRTVNLSAADIASTKMFLYHTDGSTALSADDADSLSYGFSARIVWRAASTGTYFVQVNESNSTAGGEYNISVEQQGTLNPYLVSPTSWANITRYGVFNFTAGVTCVGGPCYNVRAILDPETADEMPVKVDAAVASEVEEGGEVEVIVKLKDKPIEDLTLEDISRFKRSKKARQAFLQNSVPLQQDRKEFFRKLRQQVKDNQDRVLGDIEVVDSRAKGNIAGIADFRLRHRYSTLNAFSGVVTEEGLEKLVDDPDVEYVYPVREAHITLSQSVPLINADDVWPLMPGGSNVTGAGQTVCVIDTGINYSHADFGGYGSFPNAKVLGGYDYVNGDADPRDDNGHGSHVSGIIASEDATYRGVAPGSKLVMVKVCDSGGSCDSDDINAGLDWCVNNASLFNISIISMSIGGAYDSNGFGCDDFDPTTTQAIGNARAAGIIVFIASGNEYLGSTFPPAIAWPACVYNATSVGATSKADLITSYSNRDFTLDLLAPGGTANSCANGICATDYDGTHTGIYGTSMATPHAAGSAALIRQYFSEKYLRNITPSEIENLLKFNGVGIYDSSTKLTFPRIDAYAAVTAKGIVPTTVGATPFYTTTANPHDSSCLVSMSSGSSCNVTWVVNATGDMANYTFFAVFETDYTSNTTSRLNITITSIPNFSVSPGYPLNGTALSGNVSDFIFYASNNLYSAFSCDLYVNGTKKASNSSVANNTNTTFSSVSLSAGSLLWSVNCTDPASNIANSSSSTLIVPQENATAIINATANVTLNIDATADVDVNLSTLQNVTGTLVVSQYDVNPANVSASAANGFAALGLSTFVSINASAEIVGNLSWYLLSIYYSDSDLPSNIDESTLRIYYFNSSSNLWQSEPDSGVDTSINSVWANITHFSIFSAGGSEQTTNPPGGGGGGGGGGSVASKEPIVVTPTVSVSLVEAPKNQQIDVIYSSKSYSFKVSDFTGSLLTLKSLADQSSFTIANGLSKGLDLDNDGRFDIQLGYSGSYNQKALILFYLVPKPAQISLLPPAQRKKVSVPEPSSAEESVVEEAEAPGTQPPSEALVAESLPPQQVVQESFFARNRLLFVYISLTALLVVAVFGIVHVFTRKSAEQEIKEAIENIKK